MDRWKGFEHVNSPRIGSIIDDKADKDHSSNQSHHAAAEDKCQNTCYFSMLGKILVTYLPVGVKKDNGNKESSLQ